MVAPQVLGLTSTPSPRSEIPPTLVNSDGSDLTLSVSDSTSRWTGTNRRCPLTPDPSPWLQRLWKGRPGQEHPILGRQHQLQQNELCIHWKDNAGLTTRSTRNLLGKRRTTRARANHWRFGDLGDSVKKNSMSLHEVYVPRWNAENGDALIVRGNCGLRGSPFASKKRSQSGGEILRASKANPPTTLRQWRFWLGL